MMPYPYPRAVQRALSVVFAGLFAACASKPMPAPQSGPGAESNDASVATALVIDQFLRAANANDLDTMARLFGTADGPITKRTSKRNVDDRMFALASILRHESYRIKGTRIVPGRREEATQVVVDMTFSDRRTVEVPFTLVWSKDRTWLIEIFPTDKITGRR
jgi:hypothetical protein